MNGTELQHQIDACMTAEDMVAIARQYLEGTVIRDPVAAHAWLMRAMEADDPVWSARAMGILAREILGVNQVIPKAEAETLRALAEHAEGKEKRELDALLALV